ncbi:carbohydrate ABC transporter permease [Acidisoma cladoniae]|jgi:glucose/mannose transport system permease protein|uniref:carbohydrate ABC transporter permease n=1 Tax=Acidisoma cladoniae TaxID=3040935 RepID=UPI00254DCD2A|nr:carbohydrate ABC transporter permease [Acidisoma sp. PAMC 29798]
MSLVTQTPARPSWARTGIHGVLILVALLFAIPLVIMLLTSFKTMNEIQTGTIFSLPATLNLSAWNKAWSHACTGLDCNGISAGFWNSIRILIPSVILSIFCGAITGYALAIWRFRGADAILLALMIGAFIPYQVIIYPLVKITSFVGIYGTLPGIVCLHIVFGMPLMTMLFRNYFVSIPADLIKAARVDGAGFFRIFFEILLPMSVNMLIVALILQVTGIWNDFLLGLIFAGQQNQPMTVELNNIVVNAHGSVEYNVNMAATILTALPPLVVYLISGRYFVRGIASGAVKG